MARITAVSTEVILDTSWLLELYRVPRHSQASRSSAVKIEFSEVIEKKRRAWVTVPVLFEVANHIAHVGNGSVRHSLSQRFVRDVRGSIDKEVPWIVSSVDRSVLLRSQDILRLADQFLKLTGPHCSFADISVIDLAEELRKRQQKVRIFSFDEQLRAYSD